MNRRTTRVHDDNGITRQAWSKLDGPNLNPEDWQGLSITNATGKPVGRPRKDGRPKVRTEQDGPFLYGYTPSTRADWERERLEREEAFYRVLVRKRGRKFADKGKALPDVA